MRLVSIKDFDIINSLNISVSIWCGYCPIRCNGCHNSQYWGKDSGVEFSARHLDIILTKLNEGVDKDLSILGGEPLCDENIHDITQIVKEVKARFPKKIIMLWTGYGFENVKDYEIMRHLDIIIDGSYDGDNKEKRSRLKGSKNQRIINVQQSLKEGKVVLYET